MWRSQTVLALVVYLGLAYSWNLALSKGDLLEFYTNNTKTVTVRLNDQNLAALAYDEVHNMMLYVDKQSDNDTIGGYNITSMQYKNITKRSGRNIRGLAFDPVTELLFFTDTKERSINWISLKPDSKNNATGNIIIKMDEGTPTDIAVDSCGGYIFWINTNLATPTIEKARFNGSEREIVIQSTSLSINTTYKLEPHSLAIDQMTHKIYWIEYKNSSYYHIYCADLDGKRKKEFIYHSLRGRQVFSNLSNKLTVKKESITMLGWFSDCAVWDFLKSTQGPKQHDSLIVLHDEIPSGIASNYNIIDQIQKLQDCKIQTSLLQNNAVTLEATTEYVDEFCVHGVKVNGQSSCKCTPGYIGERCDVSNCENYCIHGNCSVNDEGFPECRCDAGYSGDRCEINECHGYCLNNGECTLNEEDEPVCECDGDHEGPRCEAVTNDNVTNNRMSYLAERNVSLADIFSNIRKPISKVTINVECN